MEIHCIMGLLCSHVRISTYYADMKVLCGRSTGLIPSLAVSLRPAPTIGG